MKVERQIGQIQVMEPEESTQDGLLYAHFVGCLMGGAIADALGWPTEFAKRPEDLERVGINPERYPLTDFVVWHKRTGGRFYPRNDTIQPGDYSDDTQLALSVARSLNADGTVDNEYFAKQELKYWLAYARGAGATVTAAARSAARSGTDWRWNFFRFKRGRHDNLDYRGAGANGAAMRIAPIALANLNDQEQTKVETWKNSIVTHGHARAIMGAIVYAEALRSLTSGAISGYQQDASVFVDYLCTFVEHTDPPTDDPDIRFWLSHWNAEGHNFESQWKDVQTEMSGLLRDALKLRNLWKRNLIDLVDAYRQLGCLEPATKGSGTVCVAAAVMLFLGEGRNFVELVRSAANVLGSDTDTIGAMAASLSGGWLGYTELPERWASLMADYTYINRVAQAITLIALRIAKHNPLRLEQKHPKAIGVLLNALQKQDVVDGHMYWHPLFGSGLVRNSHTQTVGWPKPKGRVLSATVDFEIGQTCKFSSFTPLTMRQQKSIELQKKHPIPEPSPGFSQMDFMRDLGKVVKHRPKPSS